MGLNNMFDDGQAQAGPTLLARAGFVHAIETFENTRQIRWRDADSPVFDVQFNSGSLGVETNLQ